MKWTKEKPTTPGWYWYKNYLQSEVEIKKIYYYNDDSFLFMDDWSVKFWNGWWAGPIEEPTDG